jgi:hypothetical protein
MKRIINTIRNFEYNSETKCLEGRVEKPNLTLSICELIVTDIPEIEGFIAELFSIIEPINGEHRISNIKFKKGDWYVKILITNGLKYFENKKIVNFILQERPKSETPFSTPEILDSDTFLVQLKNISGRIFGKYYMDIRGGETGAAGRSEHGEPHFHIIEFKTNKDLGKVYFPSENNTELKFECSLKSKEIKNIQKWLFNDNQKGLIKLNKLWNELNKHNNRII